MGIREDIAKVAHDLYLQSGQLQGQDLENWLNAEHLVLTWYEPDQEREKHVGAVIPDDHRVDPTHDEVID